MINWPNNLINDIARRRCVLVLGAGVSKNSTNAHGNRPKDWKELLTEASNTIAANGRLAKQLIKSNDFLTACEVIKTELGRDAFNDFMRNEYLNPRFAPADIHKHIYNLDSRIVATPNFDKIYEVYALSASQGNTIVKNYTDNDICDYMRSTEPLILKIHGTIEAPNNLIFSRKDYSNARINHERFYRILDALAITHTFIFIGCGTNDPDIRLLLEDYAFKYPLSKNHYIIMPKNAVKQPVLSIIEDTMHLKPILYDPKNNHEVLTESLEDLVTKVELKRTDLAAQTNW